MVLNSKIVMAENKHSHDKLTSVKELLTIKNNNPTQNVEQREHENGLGMFILNGDFRILVIKLDNSSINPE